VVTKTAGFDFWAQLEAVCKTEARAFSFAFGMLPERAMAEVKRRGLWVAGTATTVEEAVLLQRSGVDAVVVQGSEAGGHRGTFATDFGAGMIGLMALVPQVVDAVRVPVIASGGIMDARGIRAARALGASAVQMGTAFLTCVEAGISQAYQDAIMHAAEADIVTTRAFSGRPARGIANRVMRDLAAHESEIAPFPVQNALTRPLRAEAGKRGRAEFLSLWAGQGVRMARRGSAAELIARIQAELAREV